VACTYDRACVWCIGMGGYACVSCRFRSGVHVWRVGMVGHACVSCRHGGACTWGIIVYLQQTWVCCAAIIIISVKCTDVGFK